MRLSVLICVYNTKIEYFEKCLRSLRENSERDIEICVIDDGSMLDYSALVEKYALKYKRTENRGILAARLSAIEMASGDYLAFCDSDDTVSFDFYRPMLDAAERDGLDIVVNDWAFHTDKSRYYCKHDITICTDLEASGRGVIEKFFEPEGRQHSLFVLWNKVFRADVLRAAAEDMKGCELAKERCIYSEDAALNFFAFARARSLRAVHSGYYFYRVHSTQTVTVISEEHLSLQITYMARTLDVMEKGLLALRLDYLLPKLNEWRSLMARAHYSHAKVKGYRSLYDKIKSGYRVKSLRLASFLDGYVYAVNRLLAENFEDIDDALKKVYNSDKPLKVFCRERSGYSARTLSRLMSENENISIAENPNVADIVIPREKISPRNKFIHNFFVYTTGTILFPKGTRLREILKQVI